MVDRLHLVQTWNALAQYHAFPVVGPLLWNDLPLAIRCKILTLAGIIYVHAYRKSNFVPDFSNSIPSQFV